ncbi:uncharacterized protein [Eucyclogobius newberryi]|uniref:uncharacterized protein n=1 Tax=Eucyclogobius newberryi TaxID=166745 RepID=UPI003B59CAE0
MADVHNYSSRSLPDDIKPPQSLQSVFSAQNDMLRHFQRYKHDSNSSWRCRTVDKLFGMSTGDVILELRSSKRRIHWNLKAEKGIDVEFNGIPFVFVGGKRLICHQGPDIDASTKAKRKKESDERQLVDNHVRRRTSSKKVGCPSAIYMTRLARFPDFKLDKDTLRGRRNRASNVRKLLASDKEINVCEEFHLKLPEPSTHTCHQVKRMVARMRDPVDPIIVDKVTDLYHCGVRLDKEIKRHVASYVKEELFRGVAPPGRKYRRWFPTHADIRNILSAARSAERQEVPHDQQHLESFCQDLQKNAPDDAVFFRPSSVGSDADGDKVLFIYQASWMKSLLLKYGQQMCLMDATYRTSREALPLFFLCVRTNVSYCVAAVFITQDEDVESITEALRIIKENNKEWKPVHIMVHHSPAEIRALQACFPETKVLICDVHREKAWTEWVSKKEHGVTECRATVLKVLRHMASSPTVQYYEEVLKDFKSSDLWNDHDELRDYFGKTWEAQAERWVRAFREESLHIIINTNYGVERLNEWLESSFLTGHRNCSLSELVTVIVQQLLPDSLRKYQELNIRSLDVHRSRVVPDYLKNRPKDMVDHIMERIDAHFPADKVQVVSETARRYQATSEDGECHYSLWLGSDSRPPYCSCFDWKRHRLPCKHMCAVLRTPNAGWDQLGKCYRDNPIFQLDAAVIDGTWNPTPSDQTPTQTQTIPTDELEESETDDAETTCDADDADGDADPPEDDLPPSCKRKSPPDGARERCVVLLKSLLEQMDAVEDESVLLQYQRQLEDMQADLRSKTPPSDRLPEKAKIPKPSNKSGSVAEAANAKRNHKAIMNKDDVKVHRKLLL